MTAQDQGGARDEWCHEESCRYRNWTSGSMPTHRRGTDCPAPAAPPADGDDLSHGESKSSAPVVSGTETTTEGQANEVEALDDLLAAKERFNASVNTLTDLARIVSRAQMNGLDSVLVAEHILAAGYLSPDAVAAVAREAVKAEREEGEARGIRFRVEAACDGYAHLMDSDVPHDEYDTAAYQRGAHDAAEAIREVLTLARTAPLQDAEEVGE